MSRHIPSGEGKEEKKESKSTVRTQKDVKITGTTSDPDNSDMITYHVQVPAVGNRRDWPDAKKWLSFLIRSATAIFMPVVVEITDQTEPQFSAPGELMTVDVKARRSELRRGGRDVEKIMKNTWLDATETIYNQKWWQRMSDIAVFDPDHDPEVKVFYEYEYQGDQDDWPEHPYSSRDLFVPGGPDENYTEERIVHGSKRFAMTLMDYAAPDEGWTFTIRHTRSGKNIITISVPHQTETDEEIEEQFDRFDRRFQLVFDQLTSQMSGPILRRPRSRIMRLISGGLQVYPSLTNDVEAGIHFGFPSNRFWPNRALYTETLLGIVAQPEPTEDGAARVVTIDDTAIPAATIDEEDWDRIQWYGRRLRVIVLPGRGTTTREANNLLNKQIDRIIDAWAALGKISERDYFKRRKEVAKGGNRRRLLAHQNKNLTEWEEDDVDSVEYRYVPQSSSSSSSSSSEEKKIDPRTKKRRDEEEEDEDENQEGLGLGGGSSSKKHRVRGKLYIRK